jgi:UDP-N-acetylmuramyl pentapeptide phosphotransferase/UDP-N-acetylglucosamine-1-phosphate transferase
VIGLADDLFAMPPLPRLAGQLLVAMAVWSQGVRIGAIDLPFNPFGGAPGAIELSDGLSLLTTVIWLVGITNAINWLDGLDGLAAGVSGIAAVGLLSVSYSLNQPAPGLLAAALAGSCLGFLRHNFNPARIFMGDGGSYFLGFALAAISIVGPAKGLTSVSLLLPLLILSLPLADMSAVIMGRLSQGRSPFYPDRRHLHHRLLRAGFSHRRTVVLIYAFTQWLAALALVLVNAELRFLWLALATAVLIGVVIACRRSLKREQELQQAQAGDGG